MWAVTFTGAGDVVAGCADASAYIFSGDKERQAGVEAVAAFERMLEERKAMAKDDNSGVLLPSLLHFVPAHTRYRPGTSAQHLWHKVACKLKWPCAPNAFLPACCRS